MATGFRTKSGKIITGKFGEALARANPSQGVSVSDSPSEVIKRVSSKRGGGGSSSSRSASVGPTRADLEAEQQKQAEQRRQAEQQKQAEAEKKRIEELRKKLIASGASEREKIVRDARTGNRIRQTTTEINRIDKGKLTTGLVYISENLDTGEKTYRAYERSPTGTSRILTGGVALGKIVSPYDKQTNDSLKKIEKDLPKGISFQKDSNGNIISIDNKLLGVNQDISSIGKYVPVDKLISAGLIIEKNLPKESFSTKIKNVVSAFDPKKWKAYRENQRQDYYNLYNLKGKDRNFYNLVNKIKTSSNSQKLKVQQLAIRDLQQDLLSRDTAIRADAALVVATILGGPITGAIVGGIYKTPINLTKEEALDLESADWKKVAKIAGIEFAKEATAGYLFSRLFGLGGRVAQKIPLTKVSSKILGKKIGVLSSNALKIALVKGLEVAYAGYLASLGSKGVRTIKALGSGKIKTAVGEASGILGAYVGIKGEKINQKVLEKLSFLNPKTVKVVDGKYILRKSPKEIFEVRNRKIYLKERVLKPSIKRPFKSLVDFLKGRKPGQFRKFTKDPGLVLKETTVASSKMPFEKQIERYSNKEVTAVNTAADQLTSWISRKKLIRKPIPGEEKFPDRIKAILKKLDSGKKLSLKEIVDSSIYLKNNVAPNITILERSLYAAPDSGFRKSRLKISSREKTPTLRDIIEGNFTFKKNKPQVLIFENAKIANSPKRIQKIANKIAKNGINSVTEKELAEIISWQMKPSSKFKAGGSPIYEGGQELEITAYGSYVKRLKKVGSKYIDGTKVTFVTAQLWKPPKNVRLKIEKAQDGKLSDVAVKNLEKLLSKKINTKVRIETPKNRANVRGRIGDVPILRIRGNLVYVLPKRRSRGRDKREVKNGRGSRRSSVKSSRRSSVKSSRRSSVKSSRRSSAIGSRRSSVKSSRKSSVKSSRRSSVKSSRKSSVKSSRRSSAQSPPKLDRFTQKTLAKSQPTYYVVEKVRGKLKKLYPKPLTLRDARDYAVYSIDNNLSKTAFFVPLGKSKKVVKTPKRISGYYSKNVRKVRPYRIRLGKRKRLVNGFIEKRKYFQDTSGEKRQLKKARKLSPTQRRKMLNNLAKARQSRMKKAGKSPSVGSRRSKKISPARRRQLLKNLAKARKARARKR